MNTAYLFIRSLAILFHDAVEQLKIATDIYDDFLLYTLLCDCTVAS